MVIPGIIFVIIFVYIPIYGLVIAFQRFTVMDTIGTARWVGFDNFRIILSDRFFWDSVWNTVGISLIKMLFGFVAPIILAIQIHEMKKGALKKIVQTISYLPHFLSWVILGGMMITWLSTNGLINQVLQLFGAATNPQNHLLNANAYWLIAALSDVWKNVGWGTILYLAALSKVDPTYYEAAKIDGANRFQMIRHITIPSLRLIISLNFVLTISGLLGSNLDQTLVLQNPVNQPASEVIGSYVFRMGIVQGDFSYATAVGLGTSIIALILLVTANTVTKKLNDNESIL
jgi:putative aldouronate transport system permease protein